VVRGLKNRPRAVPAGGLLPAADGTALYPPEPRMTSQRKAVGHSGTEQRHSGTDAGGLT